MDKYIKYKNKYLEFKNTNNIIGGYKKKKNLPKEEDKYKQYINHLYEEEKVMGYYAGDNLFARV